MVGVILYNRDTSIHFEEGKGVQEKGLLERAHLSPILRKVNHESLSHHWRGNMSSIGGGEGSRPCVSYKNDAGQTVRYMSTLCHRRSCLYVRYVCVRGGTRQQTMAELLGANARYYIAVCALVGS